MQIEDQVFLFHSLEYRIVELVGFDSTIGIGGDASRIRFDAYKTALCRKRTNSLSVCTNQRFQLSLLS